VELAPAVSSVDFEPVAPADSNLITDQPASEWAVSPSQRSAGFGLFLQHHELLI
jgi:hypothetical protein